MEKSKKLFLLHERSEIWRLRISRALRREMCPECHDEVDWLTAAEAAKRAKSTEREVFRLAESGGLHFGETESGTLLVCRRSLEDAFGDKTKTQHI